MEVSDEAIAHEVKHGNTEQFGELVARYEEKLKRYGRKFLSTKEDIEDLVQEVFIKAYTHIQSFDASLRFSPWIYRIAHNTFVNELRKRGRYSTGIFDADTLFPFLPSTETSDAETLNAEQQNEIETHLDSLTPKYREVIILHYFEEMSYQEISDILKIPISTVGVRMSRARTQLSTLLTKHI